MNRTVAVIAVIAGLALASCGPAPSRASRAVPSTQTCPGSAVGGRARVPAQRPDLEPPVAASAFAGHGKLAFVSSGRLYILDASASGRPAILHAVAAPAGATAPAWSPDGFWLAFIVASSSPHRAASAPVGTLWLARGDGCSPRRAR